VDEAIKDIGDEEKTGEAREGDTSGDQQIGNDTLGHVILQVLSHQRNWPENYGELHHG